MTTEPGVLSSAEFVRRLKEEIAKSPKRRLEPLYDVWTIDG